MVLVPVNGKAGGGLLVNQTVSSRDAAIRAYKDVFTACLDH